MSLLAELSFHKVVFVFASVNHLVGCGGAGLLLIFAEAWLQLSHCNQNYTNLFQTTLEKAASIWQSVDPLHQKDLKQRGCQLAEGAFDFDFDFSVLIPDARARGFRVKALTRPRRFLHFLRWSIKNARSTLSYWMSKASSLRMLTLTCFPVWSKVPKV